MTEQSDLSRYAHRHFLRHRAALRPEQQARFSVIKTDGVAPGIVDPALSFLKREEENRVPFVQTQPGQRSRALVMFFGLVLVLAVAAWYVTRAGSIDKYLPGVPPGKISVIKRDAYVLAFDPDHRLAAWVGYRVNPGTKEGPKGNSSDPDVTHQLEDYGKDWEMAKLVPVKHVSGGLTEKQLEQVIYLTVVAPHNRYARLSPKQALDNKITKKAEQGEVIVIRGPIYKGKKHRIANVVVPSAYFCLVIQESGVGSPKVEAYIYANTEDGVLELSTPSEVAKQTGLTLPKLLLDLENQL